MLKQAPAHSEPVELRPYQQEAVQATLVHFRKSNDPAVIVLPTGSGKSLIIAELARLARRRILVLAHVKELVEQNHSKYESYGLKASVFAAGLNRKEHEQQVVFGSVQSIARNLAHIGDEFSLVIIDECHRVSLDADSQYQVIINKLREYNSGLKVLGLTATPYRLDTGWIYQQHKPLNCQRATEETTFNHCIYELPLRQMIDSGYLTTPELLDAPIALYNFEQLRPNNPNRVLNEAELNQILGGSKRATARIIDQITELAKDRQGVMIFAATVAHAKEVLTYLPGDCSAIILGDMSNRARDSVIRAFKNRQIKFLVNVSVLTTGFDAPHVDLIAILRPTDSVGLYQQIIGRGLRLSDGKKNCLILDYAGNQYDIYQPQITSPRPDSDSLIVEVPCPECGHNNQFWGKLDNDGDLIEHYGRRCQGLLESPDSSEKQQCNFRYRFKECPSCNGENDIAARQCLHCEQLLVDPDQKLKEALQLRDCLVLRCSGMKLDKQAHKGESRLKVSYYDEDGAEVKEYFQLQSKAQQAACYHKFLKIHAYQAKTLANLWPKSVDDVLAMQALLKTPDFVIARRSKNKRYWQISDKIFDYQGNYRLANTLK